MENNNFIQRYLESLGLKHNSEYYKHLYRMIELNGAVNMLNEAIVIKIDRQTLLTNKQIAIRNELLDLTEGIAYHQRGKQVLIDEMEGLISKGK